MSAVDFRQIAFERGPRNYERVFRAAICAYCTLKRPTREETTQLDDLTLGLFESVSIEARRFASAALSECVAAPPGLVHRLADQPVEISAPLLLRSQALSDVDLIALIGKHGIPHAKAIARREGLNPVIQSLIRALIARAETVEKQDAPKQPREENAVLEEVRHQLRELMKNYGTEKRSLALPSETTVYSRLRDAAVTGYLSQFAKLLRDALRLSSKKIEDLLSDSSHSDLLVALRAMDLTPEQAFLLTAAIAPSNLSHKGAAHLFLARYSTLSIETARRRVASWRDEDPATASPAELYSLASAR